MSNSIRIAVDAMGGDLGPRITIPAALEVAATHPDLELILIGDEARLSPLLEQGGFSKAAAQSALSLPQRYEGGVRENGTSIISLLHASETVSTSDKPAYALRQKQESSMWKAVQLVQAGGADACVSAGNTGALMAMGKFLLNTFPGIDRPAICKPVPTERGHCYLLDLGANINCPAEQLVQFSVMGSVLATAVDGNLKPKVALLNIGEEEIKGSEQIRLAARLLNQHTHINYVGYIEGDGIFKGNVDIVVCDGFVGNIALKVSEGVARFLADQVRHSFRSSLYGHLVGQMARPLLRKWHTQFDPARYNGASFLGLRGNVIKSHGSADMRSFTYALKTAVEHVGKQIPQRINEQFAALQM